MSQQGPPLLIVTQEQPTIVVVSLASPVYEPNWNEVVARVAQAAFEGRDVGFVTFEPPIWDVDLSDLSGRVTTMQYGKEKFALVFAPSVTLNTLRLATHSTDFKLRTLLITAIPETPSQRIEDFLVASLRRRDPLEKIDTAEEFMECIDDKWLYWYNPQAEVLARCVQALKSFADKQGWRFEAQLV